MSEKTNWINEEIAGLKEAGLFNTIRTIDSPMDAWVVIDGRRLLNFCANNYLGLANDPRIRSAAHQAIESYGVGPGAVRSIAGKTKTQAGRSKAAFRGATSPVPAAAPSRVSDGSSRFAGTTIRSISRDRICRPAHR